MNKWYIFFIAMLAFPLTMAAQNPMDTISQQEAAGEENVKIVVPPLFEYPVAPDNLPDIKSRSNWILEHFWDGMDFNQPSVSQYALDHAFGVWVSPLLWADEEVINKSFDGLLKKLDKNPTLLLQFTKAAENNLYGPRAQIWIDAPYLKFVNALLGNKKISSLRKEAYKQQKAQLEISAIGAKMPVFEYVTPVDEKAKLAIETPYTIIVFGDPFCTDCSQYKVKLDASSEISQWIADGILSLYYIIPDGESVEDWQRQVVFYPSAWKRGAGQSLDVKYDLRCTPSVYLLDKDGIIISKFPSVEELINTLKEKVEE